jgi:hypothetical protein
MGRKSQRWVSALRLWDDEDPGCFEVELIQDK